jgi:hypothetical protein
MKRKTKIGVSLVVLAVLGTGIGLLVYFLTRPSGPGPANGPMVTLTGQPTFEPVPGKIGGLNEIRIPLNAPLHDERQLVYIHGQFEEPGGVIYSSLQKFTKGELVASDGTVFFNIEHANGNNTTVSGSLRAWVGDSYGQKLGPETPFTVNFG